MTKLTRTEMKDLYKEYAVIEEELDGLTYLGEDGMPYADYRKRTDEIMERMSEIGKELKANGEDR